MPGYEDFIRTPYIESTGISFNQVYLDEPITTIQYRSNNEVDELNIKICELNTTIQRMAEFINKIDIDEEICSKVPLGICEQYNEGRCVDCIKEYFKKGGNI